VDKLIFNGGVGAPGIPLTKESRDLRIGVPLEKMSGDRAGQLDWLQAMKHLEPRVVDWISRHPLDFGRYVYVAVIPLGADESWEQTSNGDAFERKWLRPENKEWGHKSFEEYAHAFLNHRNKDPRQGFGDVPFTCYSDEMDRVEGIWRLDKQKAREVAAHHATSRIEREGAAQISMGCFPAGTPVTMEDGGTKSIEDVRVGDLVLTAEGRARRVTEVHPRPWSGHLRRISVQGQVDDIYCTSEHPFLAAKRASVFNGPRWKENPTAVWLHAGCLEEGDYVTVPANYEELTPDYATPALARLLGYYLAEGHLCKNKRGEYVAVEFTCHKDDALLAEMGSLCAEVGTKNEPVYRERTNSSEAMSVAVHDRSLAELCLRHCGTHAKTKQLDASLFSWEPVLLKHFFGAYFNGDGCQPKGTSHAGAGFVSTASRQLAEQMVLLLARIGVPTSINYVHHKAGSGFSGRDTFEHQLRVGKQHISTLAPYCKAVSYEARASGGGRKIFGHRMWVKITEVSESPLMFDGTVYNFEVEEDESYLISGVSVHNCRVPYDVCTFCGNKARSPKEYCEHPKNPGFGHVREDGALMRVTNPEPKFFDLSDVIVPAARESGTQCVFDRSFEEARGKMAKASSGHMLPVPSALLAAERWGVTNTGLYVPSLSKASSSVEPVKVSDIVKRAPVLATQMIRPLQASEPKIGRDDMVESGLGELTVPQVLSTLAGLGIVLRPEEVAQVLQVCGSTPVAVPTRSQIAAAWPKVTDQHPHLNVQHYNPFVAKRMGSFVEDRSICFPHLCKRISIGTGVTRGGTKRDDGFITIDVRGGGKLQPLAEYVAAYLKTMAIRLGEFLRDLTAYYADHEQGTLGGGLLTGGTGLHDAARMGDVPAIAAFPSSYILELAGKGSDGAELEKSMKALHVPGSEHLLGGLLAS